MYFVYKYLLVNRENLASFSKKTIYGHFLKLVVKHRFPYTKHVDLILFYHSVDLLGFF